MKIKREKNYTHLLCSVCSAAIAGHGHFSAIGAIIVGQSSGPIGGWGVVGELPGGGVCQR